MVLIPFDTSALFLINSLLGMDFRGIAVNNTFLVRRRWSVDGGESFLRGAAASGAVGAKAAESFQRAPYVPRDGIEANFQGVLRRLATVVLIRWKEYFSFERSTGCTHDNIRLIDEHFLSPYFNFAAST